MNPYKSLKTYMGLLFIDSLQAFPYINNMVIERHKKSQTVMIWDFLYVLQTENCSCDLKLFTTHFLFPFPCRGKGII